MELQGRDGEVSGRDYNRRKDWSSEWMNGMSRKKEITEGVGPVLVCAGCRTR